MTNLAEINKIMRTLWRIVCEQFDNLDKMEKFLKMHKLSKPNQEEIENLGRPITSKRIISVMKNLPKRTKKKPGPDGFTGECYRIFKELTLIFPDSSKMWRRKKYFLMRPVFPWYWHQMKAPQEKTIDQYLTYI